ncbi:hypothetical protein CQA53_06955 [Helicobacter didelphidarum]|uniref:Uncharacterized protein n=1 Tax=Helicobacter didelphidarum TaxID=2040648 RepID=A0A3D8IIM6_9HELI|nr:hypothetical protein [Helicobacter didelphidarum]RDU64973.1 hypothetical protein CQA53_06955 [Helicobacter didelphidarum]
MLENGTKDIQQSQNMPVKDSSVSVFSKIDSQQHINEYQDSNISQNVLEDKLTQHTQVQNNVLAHLKIHVEGRLFSLNLTHLNIQCRNKIFQVFDQKSNYTLEEILIMFVTNLRDQTLAEMQLLDLLVELQSQ